MQPIDDEITQPITLTEDEAAAYAEFGAACRDLEGRHKEWEHARERHARAMAALSRFAARRDDTTQ